MMSLFAMAENYTRGKAADAVPTNMEPERVGKWAASDPMVNGFEEDLSYYAHELLDVIFTANKAQDSSDSDILISLSKKLKQTTDRLLEVSRQLIAAG